MFYTRSYFYNSNNFQDLDKLSIILYHSKKTYHCILCKINFLSIYILFNHLPQQNKIYLNSRYILLDILSKFHLYCSFCIFMGNPDKLHLEGLNLNLNPYCHNIFSIFRLIHHRSSKVLLDIKNDNNN